MLQQRPSVFQGTNGTSVITPLDPTAQLRIMSVFCTLINILTKISTYFACVNFNLRFLITVCAHAGHMNILWEFYFIFLPCGPGD